MLACLAALLLVLLGLRVYFSQSRLDTQLGEVVNGQSFVARQGRADFNEQTRILRVQAERNQPSSIVVENLNIEADWFERIDITFVDKPSQQVLTLTAGSQGSAAGAVHFAGQEILYTDKAVSRLPMASLVKGDNQHLLSLQLDTPRLLNPYSLQSVRFVPKQFTITAFLSLLWTDLTVRQTATLLSPKVFLFIYCFVVALLFTALLVWLKRPIGKVWWWVLILAWLLLDMRYMYQQSQQTGSNDKVVPAVADKTAKTAMLTRTDNRILPGWTV